MGNFTRGLGEGLGQGIGIVVVALLVFGIIALIFYYLAKSGELNKIFVAMIKNTLNIG